MSNTLKLIVGGGLIYLLSIFGGIWVTITLTPAVRAANPAPPTVTTCVKIAEVTTKAGLLIEDFRCEDQDQGYVFYKNSLGFTWNRTD